MYIFLDESGTHRQEGISTIALVYLAIENINTFQNAIISIEKEIGKNTFHWSHSLWSDKAKFITAISKQQFIIKVAIIKNPFYANSAYRFALGELVVEKKVTAIIVDGKKEKSYDRKLKKVFRDKGVSVNKLRTANDESYPALRAADAIAGLIRYRHENPNDAQANTLYQKIMKKIIAIIMQ
jgi:hypothetical protein